MTSFWHEIRQPELWLFLLAAVCGVHGLVTWPVVPTIAVVLLWFRDRGQHRRLADSNPDLGRARIILISMVAHLGLNLVAIAAAWGLGIAVWWTGYLP